MCTRYITPEVGDIERHWHLGRGHAGGQVQLFPRSAGPFIRAARGDAGSTGSTSTTTRPRALVVGQWGLIPWFAKAAKLPYATVNARFEEITSKASYRDPWRRGQRCIIPALSFDEPCWESGHNVWWRFHRADGAPWGLAGLWNTWVDKTSGEVVESYTMLTLNADAHPLMSRMHKPDPKLGPEQQDKRSVVAIDPQDVDTWLYAPLEEAQQLVRLTPAEAFAAGPVAAGPLADRPSANTPPWPAGPPDQANLL